MKQILIQISGSGFYTYFQGVNLVTRDLMLSYLTLLIERAETIARGEGLSSHSSQAVRAANFINLLFDELTLENEIHMCPTHLYLSPLHSANFF